MKCLRHFLRKSDDDLSSLYREGVKAVQEGRYVVSEVIFSRILHSHPSYKFWVNMHNSVRQTHFTGGGGYDMIHRELDEVVNDKETGLCGSIELSFDHQVVHVIDFICLCMDIAYIYLNEPADEINSRLAMVYYAIVITYLFEFFHLLVLWRTEVGDGLMSQPNCNNNSYDILLASSLDIMRIFRCLKHVVIFYFLSAILSYIVLSLEYIYHLDESKDKLRLRVLNNCLELTQFAHLIVKWTVSRIPESPTSQFLMQNMPTVEFTPYEENEVEDDKESASLNDVSSTNLKPHHVNKNWGVFVDTISGSEGFSSLFSYSKRLNPGMRLVWELPKNPPVRLHIQTNIFRHNLAKIDPPTERNAFHYISWFFADDVSMKPGQSAHCLARELPELFGVNGRFPLKHVVGDVVEQHTSLTIKPKMRGTNRVFFKSDSTIRPLTALETEQKVSNQKRGEYTRDSIKRHLDLRDFKALSTVGLEELMLVGAPVLVVACCLLRKLGFQDRAIIYETLLNTNSQLMYGLNSPEYDFLVSLRNLCTVKL
ncbi:unnamed protein product [Phytomonas sp. Hart1]|nr:unnamed protein product [Phytomonas sp. Hart1]|eukprot:CCW71585.1 unnamed protein product [Phytomonas sp. isolate Hart1]